MITERQQAFIDHGKELVFWILLCIPYVLSVKYTYDTFVQSPKDEKQKSSYEKYRSLHLSIFGILTIILGVLLLITVTNDMDADVDNFRLAIRGFIASGTVLVSLYSLDKWKDKLNIHKIIITVSLFFIILFFPLYRCQMFDCINHTQNTTNVQYQ